MSYQKSAKSLLALMNQSWANMQCYTLHNEYLDKTQVFVLYYGRHFPIY